MNIFGLSKKIRALKDEVVRLEDKCAELNGMRIGLEKAVAERFQDFTNGEKIAFADKVAGYVRDKTPYKENMVDLVSIGRAALVPSFDYDVVFGVIEKLVDGVIAVAGKD